MAEQPSKRRTVYKRRDGARGSTLPSKQYVRILSHNIRGFNSAKEAELILRLTERQIWATRLGCCSTTSYSATTGRCCMR